VKPSVVRVGGVELHYITLGGGTPIVFVHGGLADYRYWQPHLPAFAARWRGISYSRRYAFPNTNRPLVPDYSPRTDAADLAALIEEVAGGPAHVVAASIGACAALFVAAERPELVRSLVVLEPPMLRWLLEIPGGLAVWREFREDVWEAAGRAFARGDAKRGVAAFIDYFVGPGGFERLRAPVQARILQNAPELEAQTQSTEKFPVLERERVAALPMPVLMLSGALTRPTHALVDAELERLLPQARRIVVAGASHDVWVDRPEVCREATLAFLAEVDG
jgi:pimeloyl-ACP methyl ester carboxylesterase